MLKVMIVQSKYSDQLTGYLSTHKMNTTVDSASLDVDSYWQMQSAVYNTCLLKKTLAYLCCKPIGVVRFSVNIQGSSARINEFDTSEY
jgi:hypothetical protein